MQNPNLKRGGLFICNEMQENIQENIKNAKKQENNFKVLAGEPQKQKKGNLHWNREVLENYGSLHIIFVRKEAQSDNK